MKSVEVLSRGDIVCAKENLFGYYAWPSVARTPDGTLYVVSSGMRMGHLCFGGKTTLFISWNDGETWLGPIVVNDTPLDDRDGGILSLGGEKLLLTWFNLETKYMARYAGAVERMSEQQRAVVAAMTMHYSDEVNARWAGSFCRVSGDGGVTWGEAHRAPATAPHGPALLKDGSLLLLGKEFHEKEGEGPILACLSTDEGTSWRVLSSIPIPEDTVYSNFYEPHVIQLPSGRLIGHIRYQHRGESKSREPFTVFQTESDDGGNTWTLARDLGCCGSPPHIIRHSSGALVCVYGRREKPYGESAMISRDDGETWEMEYALQSGAPSGDLGYPASVEMGDGSILTVFYQQPAEGELCGLSWVRWKLPEEKKGK